MNDFISPRERARQFHASYHGAPTRRTVATQTPQDNTFKSPETIAADEEQQNDTNTAAPLMQSGPPKKPKRSLKERLQSITKKQWIIIGIVVGVLIIGGISALLLWPEPKELKPSKTVETATPPPAPTTVASQLTGVQVDPATNQRPVTAIMVENSLDARPQAGLNQAGIVFEAIAEGGITRFLALFQDNEPDYIGPVRSVRPYYVQWALGFDAPVAHVGGSPDGLALVRAAKDLDQFANSSAYWRVGNRTAPHNVYTSIASLREVENKKGFTSSKFTSIVRKEEKASTTPNATKIDLNISSGNYNVHYDYDAATNSYKRNEGGKAHTDEKSGAQLSPKVVVVPVMAQGSNGKYTTYGTIGSGTVYVFQDGMVTEGTWRKGSNNEQFTFTDVSGKPLGLNPGQTWITVVGGKERVTYTP